MGFNACISMFHDDYNHRERAPQWYMIDLAMTCHLHQRIRINSQRLWSHYSATGSHPSHPRHHRLGFLACPPIYHESVSMCPWKCPLSLFDHFQLNTSDVHLHPGLHLNHIPLRIVPPRIFRARLSILSIRRRILASKRRSMQRFVLSPYQSEKIIFT